jgi:putative transposase
MSAPARRAKVERTGAALSVRRQCTLLNVARSGVYRPQPETSAEDLTLMRRIDELYLEKPFYGSRTMTFDLNEEGRGVNQQAGATADAPDGARRPGSASRHEQNRIG